MVRLGVAHWTIALTAAAALHVAVLDLFGTGRPGIADPGGGGVALSMRNGVSLPGAAMPASSGTPASVPGSEGAAAPAKVRKASTSEQGRPEKTKSTVSVPLPAEFPAPLVERPVPASEPEKRSEPKGEAPAEAAADAPRPVERPDRAPQHRGEPNAARPVQTASVPSSGGSFDAPARRGEAGPRGTNSAARGYLLLIQAEFNQRKHYPRESYVRGEEGTVRLRFVVERSGTVRSYEIAQSSGHSALDHEVERLVRRVQPLPPFPDSLERDRLELVLPIAFYLR